MIIVKNKKFYNGDGVYIGRPSILGNPFQIGKDGLTRKESIEKYKIWFRWKMESDPSFKKYVQSLVQITQNGDLVLICWCAPKACHGDFIKETIEQLMSDSFNLDDFLEPIPKDYPGWSYAV